MKLFVKDKSLEVLDYYILDSQVRVAIDLLINVEEIKDQYIERPKNWRIVYNYWKEIGFKNVYLKIISRLKEKYRNQKFYSVGLGKIVESNSSEFQSGDTVFFIAYNHPKIIERITIEDFFVKKVASDYINNLSKNENQISLISTQKEFENLPKPSIGYSPYSENRQDIKSIEKGLENIFEFFKEHNFFQKSPTLFEKSTQKITTKTSLKISSSNKLSAAVYGLGNYAKTNIIPNLNEKISVDKIHEIDPTQIGAIDSHKTALSTNPYPDAGDIFDAYFIAGFHHTHASIAVEALRNNKYAVVEKPVVTTFEDYYALLEANKKCQKLFACFHKRYTQLNDYVYKDLEISKGQPISYFCIVHEIPLPQYHWYNWSSSKSRIVSNGCHWIDHFMFLNDYSPVKNMDLTISKLNDIHVMLELENGAVQSMLLTDQGSSILGMREYIELRANQHTIYMKDGGWYKCESPDKVKRVKSINKLNSYNKMYQEISAIIAQNKSGDDLKTLESTKVMLELDKIYYEQLKQKEILVH